MPDGALVRMVPVLSVRELAPVVAFYERLGLRVTADHGDYVILTTDATDAADDVDVDDGAVELHLSRSDEHDPRTTTNAVYLRVRDAGALYGRLHDRLGATGELYLAPAAGLTGKLTRELQAREDAGEMLTRLHEIDDKPWGQREFAVIDPAGTLVRVGSPIPP